jgi:hypothetical protein
MTSEPKQFNQQESNNLIWDISLSKDETELLASRSQETDLSESNVRVCHYQIRNNIVKTFF